MANDRNPPAPRPGTRRGALTAGFICVLGLLWLGAGWDGFSQKTNFTGSKPDYYNALVHGFRHGHLYTDLAADPRLASPDPAVRRSATTALDASYYQGHYYLSYGVTPAALILLPYSVLTGGDLEPRFAVLLCVLVGFGLSAFTWWAVVRDHFGRVGSLGAFISILSLGFVSGTPLLLTRGLFYELAVAAGYACCMATAFWIYRALAARGSAALPLALASGSAGLAVGSRADLITILPALGATVVLLSFWNEHRPIWRHLLAYGLAAVVPAAAIGAVLAVYNFERFGSCSDFGFIHGQNEFFSSHDTLFRAGFLWTNLKWDYLTFPALSPNFPYVFPEAASFLPPHYHGAEAIHGEFAALVLIAFAVGSALLLVPLPRRVLGFATALALMFGGPFLTLGAMGLRADRYLIDFHPALVLLAMLGAAACAAQLPAGLGRRLWLAGFVLFGTAAALFNLAAGVQQFSSFKFTRTGTYEALERLGNYPGFWLARLGILHYGPVEFEVRFPGGVTEPRVEPLLVAGTPEMTDSLNVAELLGNQVEFLSDHSGSGGRKTATITIVPGKAYRFMVDMGALYPPLNGPYFAGHGEAEARFLKGRYSVTMDGATLLEGRMAAYDAPPWSLELGRNDITRNPYRPTFAGKVRFLDRLPVPLTPRPPAHHGIWRMRCVLPLEYPGQNFPILSYGPAGSGALVYTSVRAGNELEFAVDEWGRPALVSAPIHSSAQTLHTLDILIGPLVAAHPWPPGWGLKPGLATLDRQLQVWLDGKLVFACQLRTRFDPEDYLTDLGSNSEGFSSAQEQYPYPITPVTLSAEVEQEILGRSVRLAGR